MDKPLQLRSDSKGSFNLKSIFDKVEEEKKPIENLQNMPKDSFTEQQALEKWSEFLQILLEEKKYAVYNALQNGTLQQKNEKTLAFEFSSSSSANEFELQKERLMLYIREKLNNYSIDFQTEISQGETENYIKSKSDIFKEMAERNPVLFKMREDLGLDYNSDD